MDSIQVKWIRFKLIDPIKVFDPIQVSGYDPSQLIQCMIIDTVEFSESTSSAYCWIQAKLMDPFKISV